MNVGGEYSYTHGNTFVPAYAAMNFNNGGEMNQYESTRTNRLIELYGNYNKQVSNRVHADLTGRILLPALELILAILCEPQCGGRYDQPRQPLPLLLGECLDVFLRSRQLQH